MTKRYLHAYMEFSKISQLRPEDQISSLGICQENYEKHQSESNQIFQAIIERLYKLGHHFVEADILEDLNARTTLIFLLLATTISSWI